MERARTAFVALIVLLALQAAWYYPRLPETLATHFSGGGQPDGWSSKPAFFALHAVMVAVTVLIFWLFPVTLRRIPTRWVSLPHRDHWLAPERRDETILYLRTMLLWFGAVQLAFAAFVAQLVIRANLSESPRLDDVFLWGLAAYGVFVVVWLVRLLRRFRAPKPQSAPL